MADVLAVYTADTLIYTGAGLLAGLIVSAAPSTSDPRATFYDNTEASGDKLLELHGHEPAVIFFPDRFAPRFSTGLYLDLEVGVSVTVWLRQL